MVPTSASVSLSPHGQLFARMSEHEEGGFSVEEMTDVNSGGLFLPPCKEHFLSALLHLSCFLQSRGGFRWEGMSPFSLITNSINKCRYFDTLLR